MPVFQRCQLGGIGHMGGIYWQGFAAQEVRAAVLLERIPAADRADVADDVAYMGRIVASELNERARREHERRRPRR